jgi:hypothetical protein
MHLYYPRRDRREVPLSTKTLRAHPFLMLFLAVPPQPSWLLAPTGRLLLQRQRMKGPHTLKQKKSKGTGRAPLSRGLPLGHSASRRFRGSQVLPSFAVPLPFLALVILNPPPTPLSFTPGERLGRGTPNFGVPDPRVTTGLARYFSAAKKTPWG